jgi:hypothetical protein
VYLYAHEARNGNNDGSVLRRNPETGVLGLPSGISHGVLPDAFSPNGDIGLFGTDNGSTVFRRDSETGELTAAGEIGCNAIGLPNDPNCSIVSPWNPGFAFPRTASRSTRPRGLFGSTRGSRHER